MTVTDADLAAAMEGEYQEPSEQAVDEQVSAPEAAAPEDVAGEEQGTQTEEVAVKPTDPVPALPEEPEEPAVRSNLGRKVQAMSYELAQTKEQLQQALSRLNEIGNVRDQEHLAQQADDEDYDVPVSKAELPKLVERFIAQRDQENQQRQRAYESGVHKALVDIGVEYQDMSDEDYTAIADMALKDFKHKTNDPAINAEYNFNRAMGRFYRDRRPQARQNPLSGNVAATNAPLGGPSGTVVKGTSKPAVKLDKESAALAAAFGWSDDKIAQVLNR